MPAWSFLTNHARVLLCIAHDPGLRLRDIAATLGITERSAHSIIADLTQAGYVMKTKDGRRNRYQIQARVPLPEPGTRAPAIGEVLAVLLGDTVGISGLADSDGADLADSDGADGEPRGAAKAIKGMIAQARQDSAVSDQVTSDGPGADPSGDELRPARREAR
jgi:MarR family protein